MTVIATWRVNLLRAGYLLLIIGLGLTVWPTILDPAKSWEPARGVVVAMLGGLSLLAIIGLRHPLRMLPLLFWEIAWKTIWLARIALPLWLGGKLDAAATETAIECLMGDPDRRGHPLGSCRAHLRHNAGTPVALRDDSGSKLTLAV